MLNSFLGLPKSHCTDFYHRLKDPGQSILGGRQTDTNIPFALSAIQSLQGTRTTGSRNEVIPPGFVITQGGRGKRNTTTTTATRTTTWRINIIYIIDFIYFIVASRLTPNSFYT